MIGHGTSEPLAEFGMVWMEVEEGHDGPEKILDVLGLGVLTAASVGGGEAP